MLCALFYSYPGDSNVKSDSGISICAVQVSDSTGSFGGTGENAGPDL